jgi:flagellar biosynthesis chaperone FliJ
VKRAKENEEKAEEKRMDEIAKKMDLERPSKKEVWPLISDA